MEYYKQCEYESETENGLLKAVAWLPEKFAVVGKKIYFGNKTENPERIWTVTSVGDIRMSEKYVREHERDYKTQREASDI